MYILLKSIQASFLSPATERILTDDKCFTSTQRGARHVVTCNQCWSYKQRVALKQDLKTCTYTHIKL